MISQAVNEDFDGDVDSGLGSRGFWCGMGWEIEIEGRNFQIERERALTILAIKDQRGG
jgi:hypothetical protein